MHRDTFNTKCNHKISKVEHRNFIQLISNNASRVSSTAISVAATNHILGSLHHIVPQPLQGCDPTGCFQFRYEVVVPHLVHASV